MSPKLVLSDVEANSTVIKELIQANRDCGVLLFPELSITGYTLGDLFFQKALHQRIHEAIFDIANIVQDSLVIVGAPLWHANRLYNCAVVMQQGRIIGIVPKIYLANYREFYEKRWFSSGKDVKSQRLLGAPFGTDLLFEDRDLLMGIEICEDLWSVLPPSLFQAAAGANVVCNLSASDELVGKHAYRKELVRTQSARAICAYAYASSGVGESSSDLCYGGATLIAENGAMLAEGARFEQKSVVTTADVDLQKLCYLRRAETSFVDAPKKEFQIIKCAKTPRVEVPKRHYDPHPFVPSDEVKRDERCKEIFAIQASALARRIEHIGDPNLVIGLSGGLDSTLALLVCAKACEILNKPLTDILAISMPGFGTTKATKESAKELAKAVGASFEEIDITRSVRMHFDDIGHSENVCDVTYENAQARYRTMILMDKANQIGGIVVGTGDLSEIALGFSTYNGDHMAMYNVNAGVPKTLVRYLIAWVAKEQRRLRTILQTIIDRPVSPELLPSKGNEIVQKTESIIGPYELHDFFLYHFIKYGASPNKILMLANLAFKEKYDEATIKKWLRVFIKRFFANQFKRNAMPDGVKVGTIALSPRGDWRMPSDAKVHLWLKELDDGSS